MFKYTEKILSTLPTTQNYSDIHDILVNSTFHSKYSTNKRLIIRMNKQELKECYRQIFAFHSCPKNIILV